MSMLKKQKIPWYLVIAFLALSAVVSTAGYVFYRIQERHIVEEVENNIASIADFKVQQIVLWRQERSADARAFQKNMASSRNLREFLHDPSLPEPRRWLRHWMKALEESYRYKTAFLDRNKRVLLSSDDKMVQIDGGEAALADAAIGKKGIVQSDLHRNPVTKAIYIDFWVPLLIPRGRENDVAAVLLIRSDPALFLYPLIQTWPTPSGTAETLLIRGEGEEVVFLNELRHRKDTALTLRLPLTDGRLPAAMAVAGREGIVEGLDYRGVPVVAAIRAVPDSPWHLVAKIDRDEAYAGLRTHLWQIAVIVAALILLSALLLGFIWRNESAHEYRLKYEAGLEKAGLTLHYEYLTKYANDIILMADSDLRIIEANERALETYGYSRDELLRMTLRDLRDPAALAGLNSDMVKWNTRDGAVYETLHRRKDGTVFPIEASVRSLEIEGRTFYQGTIRDISERKRAEEAQRQSREVVERLLEETAIVAEIGRVIGSTLDIEEVYEKFAAEARRLIHSDRITVSLFSPDGKSFTIPYVSGFDVPDRRPGGIVPIAGSVNGIFIRKKSGMILNFESTEDLVRKFPSVNGSLTILAGVRSIMAIPLIYRNAAIGNLQFRSKTPNAYTGQDLRLAEGIGAQIAGAIGNARLFADLQKAGDALRESESRFRTLIERAAVGVAEIDMGTRRFHMVNRRLCEILGRTEEELTATTFLAITHPEDIHLHEAERALLAAGKIGHYSLEKRYLRKDGGIVWANATISTLWKPGEAPGRNIVVVEDITEKKIAYEKLKRTENDLRILIGENVDGLIIVDINGIMRFMNPAAERLFGRKAEYLIGRNLGLPLVSGGSTEMEIFGRDGILRIVEMRSVSINWEAEEAFLVSLRDISERKHAEENLRKSLLGAVQAIAAMVEMKDPYTAGHQRRVSTLSRAIAEEIGLAPEQCEGIRIAGMIHDIGKISVPTEILSRPGKLSDIEFGLIKGHVESGYNILKDLDFPWPLDRMILQHHERLDGSGYPNRLPGKDMLLEARIIAVADVVEAMATHRPYRPAIGLDNALEEITKNSGVSYDPEVVDVCLKLFREKGFKLEN